MTLVIPDGKGECVATFTTSGDAGPALNVWGFEWDNLTTPDDVAASIAAIYNTEVMVGLTNTVALTNVRVVINDAGTLLEGVWTGSHQGDVTADGASPQVAYLVRKTTGLAGREHRGRMYWPGCDEQSITASGAIAPTALTNLQTNADDFLAALLAADHPMILLHTDIGTPVDTVVSLKVDPKCATQRRRLRN